MEPLRRIAAGDVRGDCRGASSFVITDTASLWPDVSSWTPAFFAERCNGDKHLTYVGVPDDPVPFNHSAKDRKKSDSLAGIVRRMERGETVYGPAIQSQALEALDMERRFLHLAPSSLHTFEAHNAGGDPGRGCPRYVTLWLGNRTRSGLHYDTLDNLLLQVYGSKKVMIVAAEHSASVYPYSDAVSKSRINVESPDYAAFPKFRGVPIQYGTLHPGDVLFLRKGDWHHIVSDSAAISINCWYGAPLPLADRVRRVTAAGPLLWLAIMRDFIWHGALRQPFAERFACPKPTGQELYELVAGRCRPTGSARDRA